MENGKTEVLPVRRTRMQTVSKAITWLLGIIIVTYVFATVVSGFGFVQGFLSDRGVVDMGIAEALYASPSEKAQAVCMCVLYLASVVLIVLAYVKLFGFFNEIAKTGKPFLAGQGKRLQSIAILLLAAALLCACTTTWAYALSGLQGNAVGHLWAFFVTLGQQSIYPLIFLCMAYIFNHGMKLQTESDETL